MMTNILCFGFAEWDAKLKTNQHYVMEGLSSVNRVLFIESLGLRRPTLQKKDLLRLLWRIIKFLKGVRKVKKNLFVYAPFVIPLHKYKIIQKVNRILLFLQVDFIVKTLNFKNNLILWGYVPNMVDFIGRYNEVLSVYHCVDELAANPLIPKGFVENKERELLSKVDVVLVSSKTLYEKRKNLHSKIYYLPNVADFEHFYKANFEETLIPRDLKEIPPPRIGFLGALSRYKLDFEMIKNIAKKHKEWSFVLIGPTGEGEKALDVENFFEGVKNVYILGYRSYELLPNYVKGFDVCIIPSIVNEYTQNMFPLKFFEYLSSGKPVVAVEIKPLLEFKDYCYLSRNQQEFEQNIIIALSEKKEKKFQRIEVAKRFSWKNRIKEISQIINQNINL